ncbi:hypothetical protein AA313_de0200352 [Arthrobotrys entomopaga]|nr:hypothetical protein AA313_de0200352 [Arthrobotrys entomopaga]
MSYQEPSSNDDFEVAIICALPVEYNAVYLLFDKKWDEDVGSSLQYKEGLIGKHNVVLALLPGTGKATASSTATKIQAEYKKIRIVFLVGICGGVPRSDDEVILGDVVISTGIVQYDFGKQYPGRYSNKENLEKYISKPDHSIQSQLCMLETENLRDFIEKKTATHLKDLQVKAAGKRRGEKYQYPGATEDKLFKANYRHQHRGSQDSKCKLCNDGNDSICDEALSSSCQELNCDEENIVVRDRLNSQNKTSYRPSIHIGLVGSADTVIKSGEHRDSHAKLGRIIAFEMEGAGISTTINCIVVKGICDYADSHKNNKWQPFAAATAASALKAMLEHFWLFKQKGESIQSPPSPKSNKVSESIITSKITGGPTYDREKSRRMREVRRKLPGLIQTISQDVAEKLQWTPYLSVAPSAVCVMAACLVAGSAPDTSTIEIKVKPPVINGIVIEPADGPVRIVDKNDKELIDEEKAAKLAKDNIKFIHEGKAAKDNFQPILEQAEAEKIELEKAVKDAKTKLTAAQERMKKILKENPGEKIQAQIDEIDSQLTTLTIRGI